MLLVVATVVVGWGLLVAFFLYGDRKPEIPQPPAIGHKLEELQLQPLLRTEESLAAKDLSGKVTLMNFWGPWCTYCRVEMPDLVAIYERHKDNSSFRFVSVSCDADVATEQVANLRDESDSYLKSKGYEFPVHRDHQGTSRRAIVELAQMQQEGFVFPMTLIFDRAGTIRGFFPGYTPEAVVEMSKLVDELLKST